MKPKFLLLAPFASISLFMTTASINAQSNSVNLKNLTQSVGENTTTTTINVTETFFGSGTYTYSVSPSIGVTILSGDIYLRRRIKFDEDADTGQYLVTVSKGGISITDTIHLPASNFWLAQNNNSTAQPRGVYSLSLENEILASGMTQIFGVTPQFAALGHGPYPSITEGYFYYIPNI